MHVVYIPVFHSLSLSNEIEAVAVGVVFYVLLVECVKKLLKVFFWISFVSIKSALLLIVWESSDKLSEKTSVLEVSVF